MDVNIYAPSHAEGRQESERFYNSERTYLMRAAPASMIRGYLVTQIRRTQPATTTAERLPGWFKASRYRTHSKRTHQDKSSCTIHRWGDKDRSNICLKRTYRQEDSSGDGGDSFHQPVMLRLTVDIPIIRRGRVLLKMKRIIDVSRSCTNSGSSGNGISSCNRSRPCVG